MSPDEHIAANFRALREARGLSQAQICNALRAEGVPGMHPQTVTRIEQCGRSIRLSEAPAIAHVLGVTIQDLVAGITVGNTDASRQLARIQELTRDLEEIRRALATEMGVNR